MAGKLKISSVRTRRDYLTHEQTEIKCRDWRENAITSCGGLRSEICKLIYRLRLQISSSFDQLTGCFFCDERSVSFWVQIQCDLYLCVSTVFTAP